MNASEPIDATSGTVPKLRLWTGRTLSGLVVLFMLFDGVTKLIQLPPVIEATVKLGYPPGAAVTIGALAVACTLLYAVPRTAVVGAVLLTGYLGGALATHVRVSAGAFPIVFTFIFGALVWGALYLRDERVHAILRDKK